jgi:CRP/FNR family transcriptional regulator, cyclic AMP receptor protein
MKTLEGILAKHPFFSRVDPRYHQLVVGCASNVRFNAGEFIFQEGREANTFYLIREGKVALEVVAPGHGSLTIETLGGGEMLGWSWLIPPYRSQFDARAVEMTRAIALDGKCRSPLRCLTTDCRGQCRRYVDSRHQRRRLRHTRRQSAQQRPGQYDVPR